MNDEKHYPYESLDDCDADDLVRDDEILCDACEETKESYAGLDSDERPWGSAIGCPACLDAAHDAIEREREEREDEDRIRRS